MTTPPSQDYSSFYCDKKREEFNGTNVKGKLSKKSSELQANYLNYQSGELQQISFPL